jgi:hypothetical protein
VNAGCVPETLRTTAYRQYRYARWPVPPSGGWCLIRAMGRQGVADAPAPSSATVSRYAGMNPRGAAAIAAGSSRQGGCPAQGARARRVEFYTRRLRFQLRLPEARRSACSFAWLERGAHRRLGAPRPRAWRRRHSRRRTLKFDSRPSTRDNNPWWPCLVSGIGRRPKVYPRSPGIIGGRAPVAQWIERRRPEPDRLSVVATRVRPRARWVEFYAL